MALFEFLVNLLLIWIRAHRNSYAAFDAINHGNFLTHSSNYLSFGDNYALNFMKLYLSYRKAMRSDKSDFIWNKKSDFSSLSIAVNDDKIPPTAILECHLKLDKYTNATCRFFPHKNTRDCLSVSCFSFTYVLKLL